MNVAQIEEEPVDNEPMEKCEQEITTADEGDQSPGYLVDSAWVSVGVVKTEPKCEQEITTADEGDESPGYLVDPAWVSVGVVKTEPVDEEEACSKDVCCNSAPQFNLDHTNTRAPIKNNHLNVSSQSRTDSNSLKLTFKCPLCSKSFTYEKSLHKHLNCHSGDDGEKPFACDICAKRFWLRSYVLRHRKIHYWVQRFPCNACSSTFTRRSSLKRHLHLRHGAKASETFECQECRRLFRSSALLLRHENKHSCCDQCGERFEGINSLKAHLVIGHGDPYNCAACDERFTTRLRFVQHKATHDRATMFWCDVCGESFVEKGGLEKHITAKLLETKGSEYNQRDKVFMVRSSINSHKIQHPRKSGIWYDCLECEQSFATADCLHQHSMTKHNTLAATQEILVCESSKNKQETVSLHISIEQQSGKLLPKLGSTRKLDLGAVPDDENSNECLLNPLWVAVEEELANEDDLDEPIEDRELSLEDESMEAEIESSQRVVNARRRHACDQCDKTFTVAKSLRRHKLSHAGVKPFACAVCPSTFTRSSRLKTHVLTHTGVRPHKCDQCDEAFVDQAVLKRHRTTHGVKMPFRCEDCDRTFTLAIYLQRHKVSQHSERKYHCDECPKRFSWDNHLRRHKVTSHGEARPWVCRKCGKDFNCKAHLVSHKLSHVGVRPFGCDACGKRFTQSSHLTRHRLTHTAHKNFVCGECGKAFSLKTYLKQHFVKFHKVFNKWRN